MQSPAEWQHGGRYFQHGGHAVFYRDDGPPGGVPILALHGFPTSSWDWCKLWAGLTARHHVLAPDLLGFGLSAKPRDYPYSLLEQANLAEALLQQAGVSEFHLLAHDYSATIAQELLARHAEGRLRARLHSVCLLNGGIIPSAHRPRLMQRVLLGPLGPLVGPWMNLRSLRRSFPPIFGPHTKPTPEEFSAYWHFIAHNNGPNVLHRLIHYITERRQYAERWVGALRDTKVPVRYIFGECDPISGAHMLDALRAIRPDADIHALPDIGHYPQMEAAHEVLRRYLEFLARVR